MGKVHRLWYRNPAKEWIEALPLGNGRIGAMVYGGTGSERIQIDESSFWSGAPSDENNRRGTRALMEKIRRALLEGDYEKADTLGHDFVGNKNQYGTNMPTGELLLCFQPEIEDVKEYERWLDLSRGMTVTKFTTESTEFVRESFVSNPAQVFCLKFTGTEPFSLEVGFKGIGNNTSFSGFKENTVFLSGDALENLHSDGKHGVHLEGCMKISTDGNVVWKEDRVYIQNTKQIELFLDMETNMFVENPLCCAQKRVEAAFRRGYEDCKKEHIRDVEALFSRVEFSLGQEEKSGIPTDERIVKVRNGEEDLALFALMYQYGRYLLIASSREDSPLPTHMGGIWNDNIYNNIDCTQDMHIDMNLQMQYWAAAQSSLPECYTPFFRYLEQVLVPSGEKTAKEAYEMDGWTAHVVSNPWGFTSLGWAYNWGAWSMGGVWCALLIWDYYLYTGDKKFLFEKGFSILEGAVKFALDYVFYDEKSGFYMTGPSYSPETQFKVNGKNYFLSLSNTCDVLLIRELLNTYEKAAEATGFGENEETEELLKCACEVREKLPPYFIGKYGQIQEWFYDFKEPIPNHRHTSHLLGLYPFYQIHPEKNESLCRAARRSLERRRENFEITSWGMNMLIGYYARLGDGASAFEIMQETFRKIVKCNMASVMADKESMWKGTWELDGNTGFTAAVSELLVQSTEKTVWLLPALPPQWKEGVLKGISLKNRGKIDIFWKNGKLEYAVIYGGAGKCEIRYENKVKKVVFCEGKTIKIIF